MIYVMEAPTDYVEPVYESNTRDHKINLGWHSIGGVDGNTTLENVVAQTKGLNVISPTWFRLTDNEGNYSSFATADYVEKRRVRMWICTSCCPAHPADGI